MPAYCEPRHRPALRVINGVRWASRGGGERGQPPYDLVKCLSRPPGPVPSGIALRAGTDGGGMSDLASFRAAFRRLSLSAVAGSSPVLILLRFSSGTVRGLTPNFVDTAGDCRIRRQEIAELKF